MWKTWRLVTSNVGKGWQVIERNVVGKANSIHWESFSLSIALALSNHRKHPIFLNKKKKKRKKEK